MAHFIGVVRGRRSTSTFIFGCAFLFLFRVGNWSRPDGEKIGTVAVNWDADEERELDKQLSNMITDALDAGGDWMKSRLDFRIYPETGLYQPELTDNE